MAKAGWHAAGRRVCVEYCDWRDDATWAPCRWCPTPSDVSRIMEGTQKNLAQAKASATSEGSRLGGTPWVYRSFHAARGLIDVHSPVAARDLQSRQPSRSRITRQSPLLVAPPRRRRRGSAFGSNRPFRARMKALTASGPSMATT